MKIVSAWELKNTLRAYSSSRTTRLPDGLQAAPFGTLGLRLSKLVLPTMGSRVSAIPASTPSSRTWKCPVRSTDMTLRGRHTSSGRRRLSLWYREVSIQIGAICRLGPTSLISPLIPGSSWPNCTVLSAPPIGSPLGPLRKHSPVAWHQGMRALAPSSRTVALWRAVTLMLSPHQDAARFLSARSILRHPANTDLTSPAGTGLLK